MKPAQKAAPKPAPRPKKEPKLSRAHAPEGLSPRDWQRALRRQFGREQDFGLENLGDEPFFLEFRVSNPVSKSAYRVAIRGLGPGGNFCSCPDYATGELGTCKHIEFALGGLEKKRGAKAAFARGAQPAYSELFLRKDGERRVHFRAAADCPPEVVKAAKKLFDFDQNGVLARSAASRGARRASSPAAGPNVKRTAPSTISARSPIMRNLSPISI